MAECQLGLGPARLSVFARSYAALGSAPASWHGKPSLSPPVGGPHRASHIFLFSIARNHHITHHYTGRCILTILFFPLFWKHHIFNKYIFCTTARPSAYFQCGLLLSIRHFSVYRLLQCCRFLFYFRAMVTNLAKYYWPRATAKYYLCRNVCVPPFSHKYLYA